jgi:hypothetical protein
MASVSSPEANTRAAKDSLLTLVRGVWPKGREGDEEAIQKASDTLSFMSQEFYQLEPDQFNFARFSGEQGYLASLSANLPMMKGITDDQKQAIASQVAGSAAWAGRVLAGRVKTKNPALHAKVNYNRDEVLLPFITPKPEFVGKLSKAELNDIAHFNSVLGKKNVLKAVRAYGGFSGDKEAWDYIWQMEGPVIDARAAVVQPVRESATTVAPQATGGAPYPDGTILEGPDGEYIVRGGRPVKL